MTVNKEDLTYRDGTLADVERLQALRVLAYGQFESTLTADNWKVFSGNMQDQNRLVGLLKISRCFVCQHGEKIVGAAYIVPSGHPTDLFKSEWSHIRMVGVDPGYRGLGIATALTRMCVEFARKTNEKTVALHTSEFMSDARHIYENAGFKVLREIPPLFGKRYWLYTLELN